MPRASLLLALLLGCGASKPAATSTEPVPSPTEPNDAASLEDQLRLTVLESYRAIGAEYTEAYQDALGKEPRTVFINVRRGDLVVGFDVVRAMQSWHYLGDQRLEIASQELAVHLGSDGKVGWLSDHLSYRVGQGRRTASVPLRATAVFVRRDNRWVKLFEHVSFPRSREDLLTEARAGRVDAPAPIPASVIGNDAEAAVSAVHPFVGGGDAPAVPADFLLIPPWSGEERESQTVAALFGKGTTVTAEGFFVDSGGGQSVAWVAANLAVQGRDYLLPLRATWVLAYRDGAYQAVQMHLSAPLPDRPQGVLFGQ